MISTRTLALLLCVVAFAGCKKKGATAGGDAEPAGSAAPADSSSAAPSGAEAGGTDDSAVTAVGGNEAAAPDEAGPAAGDAGPTPTSPTGGGNTFAGTYSCMGGLTLSQTGNGVRGSAITRVGNTTTNYDISCTVSGNVCAGTAVKFVTKEGKAPKSAGGQKIVFKLASGGLDYTEGGVGAFCTRR